MSRRPLRQALRILSIVGVVGLAAVGLAASPAVAAPTATAGSIQVVDGDGVPIVGAGVFLTDTSFTSEYRAVTLADGRLDLTTVPGFDPAANPYTLFVSANGSAGFWDGLDPDDTEPVQIVAGGPELVVNVGATNGPPDATSAGISGTVTDALTGDPIVGIQVVAVDDGDGDGDGQGAGQTVLDGTYYLNFSGGELPGSAAVSFTSITVSEAAPYGYARQSYDGVNAVDELPETPVPVTAGETSGGIDAQLVPNGLISGVVTEAGPGGVLPLGDAQVSVWNLTTGTEVAGGSTNDDGSYGIPVAPGTYAVSFDRVADGNVVATQFYDGVATIDEATGVDVVTREETAGIDAQFGAVPPPPATPTPAPAAVLSATGPEDALPLALAGGVALLVGAVLVMRRRRVPAGD